MSIEKFHHTEVAEKNENIDISEELATLKHEVLDNVVTDNIDISDRLNNKTEVTKSLTFSKSMQQIDVFGKKIKISIPKQKIDTPLGSGTLLKATINSISYRSSKDAFVINVTGTGETDTWIPITKTDTQDAEVGYNEFKNAFSPLLTGTKKQDTIMIGDFKVKGSTV